MKIFVTNAQGELKQVEGESVVLELENGKTVELADLSNRLDYPHAVTLWGGRQPQENWTKEDLRLTEQLNLTLIAGNCVNIWPGRAKKGTVE
ncbi:hypothetical protein Q5705_07750 [Kosakonia sp. H02]|nr:hypothetical protein Q5705_07750 [Kosakonia sp. H02]